MLKDGLDLRAEEDPGAGEDRLVQRLDAYTVTGKEELLATPVPDG